MRRLIFALAILTATLMSCSVETAEKKASAVAVDTTPPLKRYGALQVKGLQLCDKEGNPVQLAGLSTMGYQWYGQCYTKESITKMVKDWHISVLRLAMYVEEGGYNYKPEIREEMCNLIDICEELGIYCIMDWHILTPGNPLDPRYSKAEDFFRYMAKRNANKQNVLYEICNEPNGSSVTWDTIAIYANKIIPVIHAAYDSVGAPHPIIVVGTPQWCQLVDAPIKEGRYQGNGKDLDAYLPDRDARLKYDNIMYAFHFYAASHNEGFEKDGKPHYYDMYTYLYDVLGRLPVFCTEFGCVEAWGGGDEDFDRTDKWLHMLSGNNAGKQRVSFCNWSFCDKEETASILQPGSCKANEWDRRTPAGEYLKRVLGVINWGAQDTTVLKKENIYIKK